MHRIERASEEGRAVHLQGVQDAYELRATVATCLVDCKSSERGWRAEVRDPHGAAHSRAAVPFSTISLWAHRGRHAWHGKAPDAAAPTSGLLLTTRTTGSCDLGGSLVAAFSWLTQHPSWRALGSTGRGAWGFASSRNTTFRCSVAIYSFGPVAGGLRRLALRHQYCPAI